FTCSPGSATTRIGLPNCSTIACSVWLTVKGMVKSTNRATMTMAAPRMRREFMAPSPLRLLGGRRRRTRGWRLQRRQRQIGQHPCLRRRLVENDLVGAFEDVLHRLDVEALRGHVLRLLIGLVDGEEAARVALRVQHHLLAVGLGRLDD